LKHSVITASATIFAAVLLAALAPGLATARAEEANPTAPASTASVPSSQASLSANPGQVKKEEREEENVFRHTKLVQAISDAVFHDNRNDADPARQKIRTDHVELTARTFEWINAAIIILAIVIPLAKLLPRVMRGRAEMLKKRLEEARKTTSDANTRLSAVEAQLSRLDEEIGKIRATVEEESKQDEARIKASIEEERTRIVASAEQEISAAAAHAQRGLRHFAADLAIESAARQLILTPETDRALIDEFVSDTTGAARGGRS
jgi:F-type H+-transporting ATPase subunit b